MKYKILVVDDDRVYLEVTGKMLKKANYSIQTATRGFDALDEIKQNPPDLLLLDLMLPDIDGMNICKMLKQDSSLNHIPIIMVTGKNQVGEMVAGLKTGADDYISKPFDSENLLAFDTKPGRERFPDLCEGDVKDISNDVSEIFLLNVIWSVFPSSLQDSTSLP